mgnify:FL=1
MDNSLIRAIANCNYNYIGIRHLSDDEHYQVGDWCRNSYDWDYEQDCSTYETENPIELPGTCAYNTGIDPNWDEPEEIAEKLEKAIEASGCYLGDLVIVAGDRMEYGNDDHEIIIADAVVISILAE